MSGGNVATGAQGDDFLQGQFDLNDTWRWGFDISRASSADYVRDFHLGTASLAAIPTCWPARSTLEGFGQGAYSRLDVGSTRA